ncbi:hypothetical protein C2S53_012431 [Perilla frutescens var. hirtella]|uniref:Uncharacterized protein n=1 Tax=Perilla frutescens var. hirtella TaxID=608512 RepID=A0AAD4JK49_PERFH|nr:hypothetical protein C2S53_012431 [Perilla frutescens var. hirtella]
MSQGRDKVSISIEGLVSQLGNPTQSKPTIFEVDDRLRQVNVKDYEPEIISIGPIHRGKDHVKSMEQHKVRYLQQILEKRADLSLDIFVKKLRESEENARKYYSTSLNLNTDKFVEMLLLDGCFVIQLIRTYFFDGKADNDPVFESETLSQIRHDLMLFENQLPFFVLNQLFDMTKTGNPDDNLCHLVLFLVEDMFPWSDVSKLDPDPHPDHLLGLVYQCFSPFSTKTPSKTKGRKGKKSAAVHINSASELKEAGIRLKGSEEKRLTFEGRVLKFPPLQVSGKTESLLRNVMAYEQLRLNDNHPKHVTDYTFFMHCLIRSTKDIEILRRSGIISNYLGGDDKIYDMFHRLGTNFLRSSEFYYSDVFESLNTHCGRRLNKWMANLRRNYFNSPWSMIKFVAATMLLLLTLAQTVFSILSFKYRKT